MTDSPRLFRLCLRVAAISSMAMPLVGQGSGEAPPLTNSELCELFVAMGGDDHDVVGHAVDRLFQLRSPLHSATVLAARAAPEALVAAIRQGLPSHDDATFQASYVVFTAEFLSEVGLYDEALALLSEFGTVVAEGPKAGHAFVLRWRAEALVVAANVNLYLGHRTAAESSAAQAEALATESIDQSTRILHKFSDDAKIVDRTTDQANRATAALANAIGARAMAWIELGLTAEAGPLLARQMELARSLRPREGEDFARHALERAYRHRADYYLAQGRVDRLPGLIEEYLADSGAEDVSDELAVLVAVGQGHQALRDPDAIAAARAALEACLERHIDLSLRARVELALFRILLKDGDLEEASQLLADLRERKEGGNLAAAFRPQMLAELESCASQLWRRLPVRTEKAGRQQLQRHREALSGLFEQWVETPVRPGGVNFLKTFEWLAFVSEYIELVRALDGVEQAAETAMSLALRIQDCGSSTRELGAPSVGVAEVRQALLGERDGVVVFLPSKEESHLIALDRRCLREWRLPGWLDLEGRVTAYFEALLRDPRAIRLEQRSAVGEQLIELGGDLTSRLLPNEALDLVLSWDQVIVADHGLLMGLPLECLVVAGEPLGERLAVTTMSSLPVAMKILRERYAPVAPTELTVDLLGTLASPAKGREGVVLTPEQVAPLLAPYPGHRRRLGREVSPTALRAWEFKAPVTHFLAHGARVSNRERPYGLGLAPGNGDDGFLGCREVDALGKTAGLVILSACESATDLHRWGDETYYTTLGGAFLRTGAHTVVQSSADLTLGPHLDLMAAMHRQLVTGASTAEALRRARAEMAEGGADLVDRLTHAQVRAFGLGTKPIVTER